MRKAKTAAPPTSDATATIPSGDGVAIGARLRHARGRSSLTLDQVAVAAGLTAGHLSRLERGEKLPSIGALAALARALGTSINEFVGADPAEEELVVVRAGRRTGVGRKAGKGDFRYEALLQGAVCAGQSVTAFVIHPQAEAGTMSDTSHQGIEFLYVLTGTIEIVFAERVVSLGQGDVILFPGYLKHRVRCQSEAPASALVVMTGA
jgi:transcriptional regulator with XRE-family HTH domain